MPIWVYLGYTERQLHTLRSCMFHKDAMWLSDLTEADRVNLFRAARGSSPMPSRHHPDPTKPNVAPKRQLDWFLWNAALQTLVSRSRCLLTPLGPWAPENPNQSKWKWWHCSGDDRLYSRQGSTWTSAAYYPHGRNGSPLYLMPVMCSDVPTSLQRVSVVPQIDHRGGS